MTGWLVRLNVLTMLIRGNRNKFAPIFLDFLIMRVFIGIHKVVVYILLVFKIKNYLLITYIVLMTNLAPQSHSTVNIT